jgi:hypothetical protein
MHIPFLAPDEQTFVPTGDARIDEASDLCHVLRGSVMDAFAVARLSFEGLAQQELVLGGRQRRTGGSWAERTVEKSKQLDERFLRDQKTHGYPILWNHAVSTFWNQLEAFVEDFAGMIIDHDPDVVRASTSTLLQDVHTKLMKKPPPSDEWASRAVHLIKQRTASQGLQSQGARRFEEVLDILGLARAESEVPPQMDERLGELSAIRNVLAHRRGRIDARFIRDVARVQGQVSLGDEVRLNFVAATVYGMTAVSYGAIVLRRYCRRCKASAEHLEQVDRVIRDYGGSARNHVPTIVP